MTKVTVKTRMTMAKMVTTRTIITTRITMARMKTTAAIMMKTMMISLTKLGIQLIITTTTMVSLTKTMKTLSTTTTTDRQAVNESRGVLTPAVEECLTPGTAGQLVMVVVMVVVVVMMVMMMMTMVMVMMVMVMTRMMIMTVPLTMMIKMVVTMMTMTLTMMTTTTDRDGDIGLEAGPLSEDGGGQAVNEGRGVLTTAVEERLAPCTAGQLCDRLLCMLTVGKGVHHNALFLSTHTERKRYMFLLSRHNNNKSNLQSAIRH